MYNVHDWAEVHRLYDREHLSKRAIARRLRMSRPTVRRLLEMDEPPRYERAAGSSKLDPLAEAIPAMLGEDPKVPATVILGRLRSNGYTSGTTILNVIALKGESYMLKGRGKQVGATTEGSLVQGFRPALTVKRRRDA